MFDARLYEKLLPENASPQEVLDCIVRAGGVLGEKKNGMVQVRSPSGSPLETIVYNPAVLASYGKMMRSKFLSKNKSKETDTE